MRRWLVPVLPSALCAAGAHAAGEPAPSLPDVGPQMLEGKVMPALVLLEQA